MEPEDISLLLILFITFVIFVVFASVGKQIDFLVEFSAGILGVIAGFSLARRGERRRDKQTKKDLMRDLHEELKGIRNKLTGKALLLYPEVWDSAIASGQVRLLESEQVRKLASVYRFIKGTEYEAKKVQETKEDYERVKITDPHAEMPMFKRWDFYSRAHRKREERVKEEIEEILKEKWWTQDN